jgi:two-component system, LuxR family, sensor histidine kinase TtrS
MRRQCIGLACLCILVFAANAFAEVKIGMLAQRGPEIALKEWGPLGEYLSEKLGEKVTIVPLSFTDFMDFVDIQHSGFIFTNPWFFVRAKVLKGARPLVTVKYQGSGSQFGGVILTRRDSGISSLRDLYGKVVMCPKLTSPGGWLFQKGEMVKQGITPEKDFKLLLETPNESHDDVVYAVRDGKADVGTVRTNLLEAMQREGKIKIDDFLVLNKIEHEGFPELTSTALYPDWPVGALRDTPGDLEMKMKKALLSIPKGHPALIQARKIDQFIDALDYAPMEELCRFLKVPPFRRMADNKQKR